MRRRRPPRSNETWRCNAAGGVIVASFVFNIARFEDLVFNPRPPSQQSVVVARWSRARLTGERSRFDLESGA
ncbi:hypothetical protein EVAR_44295_1 [Eumeta japonica]|uniref:Uncharacterized protein n=1 Tax=Eumeta variegata TaxID=151549 RepID=A0A4C1WT61_EUMVA|nr:hypothetical protein EVAR_44295_1 [Eumeta japonica]